MQWRWLQLECFQKKKKNKKTKAEWLKALKQLSQGVGSKLDTRVN